jgi:hypothetical protein
MRLFTNKKVRQRMTGRSSSAAPVRSWQARDEGSARAVLSGRCRRRRSDDANGQNGRAARTGTNEAERQEMKGKVMAGSALGRWPNPALQVRSVSLKLQPNNLWGRGS